MEISYTPIAFFNSSHSETYEAPRQGVLAQSSHGVIEFVEGIDFESYEDLIGFERLWIVYDFHKNQTWKPKVRPPRFSDKKRSVLSTRSPYRPNSIGVSCVKIEKVEKGRIFVSEQDLLDKTPILDLKPYLPYSDSFPEVKTGWVKEEETNKYKVIFTQDVKERVDWLMKHTNFDFEQVLQNQLSYEPTNSKTKRVKKIGKDFTFAIRTWRFKFKISNEFVNIYSVFSGYKESELLASDDIYKDKASHKEFLTRFL